MMLHVGGRLVLILAIASISSVSQAKVDGRPDPYACAWFVDQLPPDGYRDEIARRLVNPPAADANDYPYRNCILAELMARTGDSRAPQFFELTIEQYPDEPAFELFYANYLQFLRGSRNGLVVAATRYYDRVRTKLTALEANGVRIPKQDDRTKVEIDRSLLWLHRSDGWPLRYQDPENELAGPRLFFSTINEYAHDTIGTSQWIDSREFTSEVLFAESAGRLNRSLTQGELLTIARTKPKFVTTNRVRIRFPNLRAIDFTYGYQNVEDASIANFFEPTRFKDDIAHQYGVSIENDFRLTQGLDLFVRGGAKHIEQTTSAEFFGNVREDIWQYETDLGVAKLIGKGKVVAEAGFIRQDFDPGLDEDVINIYSGRIAYQSRLFGLNRFVFDGKYVYQDVKPGISASSNEDKQAIILSAGYEIPLAMLNSSEHGLAPASAEIIAGFIDNVERIGSIDIKKREGYLGIVLRRVKAFRNLNPFDFTLKSGVYTAKVEGDPSQEHGQLRNEITIGYRIVDAQSKQGDAIPSRGFEPTSVQLEFPLRHDEAIDGPDHFENFRLGVRLRGEFINGGSPFASTFYASAEYAFERFYNLDKGIHLFTLRIGTGF